MSEHTPGPWEIERFADSCRVRRAGRVLDVVADVYPGLDGDVEANASVIKASLDMLDALKEVCACFADERRLSSNLIVSWKVAKDAIAKAEGRDS